MKGYIQVYTGNGKGKTTASLGLAIRAAGAGFRVYIAQFLKQENYSEIKALTKFGNITIQQFGAGEFVKGSPSEEEKYLARKGYDQLCKVLSENQHNLVIAEEANVAVKYGLFSEEELLALMDMKPETMELVITGRGARQSVIDRADLVTEMREIKHYYHQGVPARVGIEK